MRHIHIVDSDGPFRTSLRLRLSERSNLIIRCFASGESFLAQADGLDPGVVVLDLDMPDTDGLDVLRAAGNTRFATIALTGRGDIPLAVDAMKAGARDFVEKPCEPARLLRIVDEAFTDIERTDAAANIARTAKAKITQLSPREADVLRGLMDGRPNKAIASDLAISHRTVEVHRAGLMGKLGVRSLSEVLGIAFAAGMFAVR